MDQTIPISHARKKRTTEPSEVSGLLCVKRNGYHAYLDYNAAFAVDFTPSIEGALEQIQCRFGDSFVTIDGKNLFPLFEDLYAKRCARVQESDPGQDNAAIGVRYIDTITVRLWL
jgi:hypothetical protein